jgi:hypothetical protein
MMLVHHFTAWLTHSPRSVLPGFPGLAFSDVAAPVFALTAGAGLALFLERSAHKGMPAHELRQQVIRRYGALVPIGMMLTLVALSNPFYFSVLDALGWATLATAVIVRGVRSAGLRWAAAGAMFLASAPANAFFAEFGGPAYVVNAFTGKFPILEYAGFALVGALVAPHLKRWSGRDAAGVAGVSVVVAAAAVPFIGAPDRYPGGLAFVVPGLAGAAVLYALMLSWKPSPAIERGVVVAGTRSLGIYVSHYALFMALRATGIRETLPPVLSLGIALALTLVVVVAALRLPPLPFSVRKGSAARAGEMRLQEADGVGPDLVAVVGGVGVAGENDEPVIDLRRA